MSSQDFGEFAYWNAVLARRAKVLFVPTPKVACTTIKWALASAESTLSSGISVSPEPTTDLTIHDPSVHGMGVLGLVSEDERQEAFTSPDWIRFCVTRSPYERIVSAWLNRVVFGMPSLLSPAMGEQFGSDRDYGTAFRRFVRRLSDDPVVLADTHFSAQGDVLEIDTMPYTHVLDLAGLNDFLVFLRSSGSHRERIVLGRSRNSSPRIDVERLYDSETAAIVDRVCASDFRRFSYPARVFADVAPPYPIAPNEFSLIEMMRDRADRFSDVFRLVDQQRRQISRQSGGRYGAGQLAAAAVQRAKQIRRVR